MKKIIYIVLLSLFVASCSSDDSPSGNENPNTENPLDGNDGTGNNDGGNNISTVDFDCQSLGFAFPRVINVVSFPSRLNPITTFSGFISYTGQLGREEVPSVDISIEEENPSEAFRIKTTNVTNNKNGKQVAFDGSIFPKTPSVFDKNKRNKVTAKIKATVAGKCFKTIAVEININ